MSYVFDTNSISTLRFIFQSRFLNFWRDMQDCVNRKKIISTREVKNELDVKFQSDEQIQKWITENKDIFLTPALAETTIVERILSHSKFKGLLDAKALLRGPYFADPFIIALAKVKNACVVTQEVKRDHGIAIPNVCEEFKVKCTDLEGFMVMENMEY